MTTDEVRSKYLAFFKMRGHSIIPSASLVPENDPTTLFTGSGMQPLLPYLLGEKHPQGNRLVNSQKCFRAEDIKEVGDNRHTTFFEMLGNWSFGEYWKEDQLTWFFEFLTDELKISKECLWVTCFEGDKKLNLPPDNESGKIWEKLGISKERIIFYGSKKNWWSRAGAPANMPEGEPGGPDSEVFYEFTEVEHNRSFGENCHPNCDCGRFMEIGNCVFMQYIKVKDGSFSELPQKNVDFGGGLERLTAAANNEADVFQIDSLQGIVAALEQVSGYLYNDEKYRTKFRVIADHMRAVIFMINDGVFPSNTEQGYFVRRLIRRSMIKLRQLGSSDFALGSLVHLIAKSYAQPYPSLQKKAKAFKDIDEVITDEETMFQITIKKGLREFEKLSTNIISGKDAFMLFSTYGFPVEMTIELASEKGVKIDTDGFETEMKKHQEISRKGAEQKFKGGLADHSEISVKYHTATHLLHQALRDVLGKHVLQKGSNITGERLRFDFSHSKKMTDEEMIKVEDLINQKIEDALSVSHKDMPIEEAKKLGAIGLFEEKYTDNVRLYKIDDFSLEYCGGPHVENTKSLGHFKIKKEEAVSAGVRRIKAILE